MGGLVRGDLELKAAWAMAFQFHSYCERMWLGSHLWSRMSSGNMPRNAITDSLKFIFSFSRVSTLFAEWLDPFAISPGMNESSLFPASSPALLSVVLLILDRLAGVYEASSCFDSHFPNRQA